MRVVGESNYQRALNAIQRTCVPGAEARPSFPVQLLPEPENPHDADAIAVISQQGCVGYLPRDDAHRYKATFRALREAGYDGGTCTGLLNGGSGDKPSFGVTLCISYPEDCEKYFGLVAPDGKPTTGRVRGRHFTDYASDIKQLRRAGRDDDARDLLLQTLPAMEEEAAERGASVLPWYYEQLAIIYRKQDDRGAEIQVLDRFARQSPKETAANNQLLKRLDKARRGNRLGP